MNKTKIATLVAYTAVGLSTQAQNLLLNGSFESPVIPANTIAITTPASWQGSASTRIMNGNYSVPPAPGPQDGQQYVSLGNDGILGSVSQAFTITTPGIYVLSWFDSAGDTSFASPYSLAVLGPGGAVTNAAYNASHAAQSWLSKSMQLNLSPGSYTVKFRSEQPTPGGVSSLIDNVSLQANLLLNGSFESPVIPANTIAITTPASWQGSASTRIINGNYGAPDFPGPQNGQQYLSLGNDGVLAFASQEFTIMIPGVYVLSWFDSGGDVNAVAPYSVAVLGVAGVVANVTNRISHQPQGWLSKSMQLNLGSGVYTVKFRSEQPTPGGASTQIDYVSLQTDNSDLRSTIHFSAVDICWAGFTNQLYQVQYRTNLSDTTWFDLGSPTLGTGTNCVTDGINGNQQRFYRIIRIP